MSIIQNHTFPLFYFNRVLVLINNTLKLAYFFFFKGQKRNHRFKVDLWDWIWSLCFSRRSHVTHSLLFLIHSTSLHYPGFILDLLEVNRIGVIIYPPPHTHTPRLFEANTPDVAWETYTMSGHFTSWSGINTGRLSVIRKSLRPSLWEVTRAPPQSMLLLESVKIPSSCSRYPNSERRVQKARCKLQNKHGKHLAICQFGNLRTGLIPSSWKSCDLIEKVLNANWMCCNDSFQPGTFKHSFPAET